MRQGHQAAKVTSSNFVQPWRGYREKLARLTLPSSKLRCLFFVSLEIVFYLWCKCGKDLIRARGEPRKLYSLFPGAA